MKIIIMKVFKRLDTNRCIPGLGTSLRESEEKVTFPISFCTKSVKYLQDLLLLAV